MSHQEEHDEREGRRRRPYEAPAVADSAVFETLALACGKTVGELECELTASETAS